MALMGIFIVLVLVGLVLNGSEAAAHLSQKSKKSTNKREILSNAMKYVMALSTD